MSYIVESSSPALYEQQLIVHVSRPNSIPHPVLLQVKLTKGGDKFTSNSGFSSTPMSLSSGSLLHIEVTDPKDSFFLLAMAVSGDEYLEIKRDQSLLVDFNVFPSMLIDLLEQCRADQKKTEAKCDL